MRWLGSAAALAVVELVSSRSQAVDPAPAVPLNPSAAVAPTPTPGAKTPAKTAPAPGTAPAAKTPSAASPGASTAAPATKTAAAPPSSPTAAPATKAAAAPPSSSTAAPSPSDPPTADAAESPTAVPPSPPSGPPPQYYVEPQAPTPTEGAEPQGAYEPPPPPPPVYEPPPPAEAQSLAPKTAFWVGARLSWFIPFGSVWLDGFNGASGLAYRRRTFASYAATGPAGELDIGARLSRRYMVFALFEHASLGAGSLDDKSFGGQNRGASNFYGAGLRFSTEPGSVGFAMEIALGYRDFHAHWSDGTELSLTDGFIDARLGLGADIRVNRWLSLSPMLVLGGGSFGSTRWSGPAGSHDAQTSFDQPGEYGTFALQLGGHVDVF